MPGLIFRVHAIRRMFERGVSREDVTRALEHGHTIEDYPDDVPYPSRLVLGWSGSRPLYLVVAEDPASRELIVVTVYEPDPQRWEPDFRRRRAE